MDQLSGLLDEVINLILEKLPLRDRVKTSTLSRCWRFKWTRLPSLPMDIEFYQDICGQGDMLFYYATVTASLVLQHEAGCIREFSLYIPTIPAGFELFHHPIQHVVKSNDLERFHLESEDEGFYKVPSSIFCSKSLRLLTIYHTQLCLPSWFDGFPNLTSFELISHLSTVEVVSHFVSVCPNLEKVFLEGVCFGDRNLDLKTPKLRRLHVRGQFGLLSVSNSQNLESAVLYKACRFQEEAEPSIDMFKIFTCSDLLQHVSLNGPFCELLGSSSVIGKLPRFGRMKTLNFFGICVHEVDMLQCFLSFCACSPNVGEVRFTAFHMNLAAPELAYESLLEKMDEYLESLIAKYINNNYEHLVRIDMNNIFGTKTEMKIIELLLKFSPALEMMTVSFVDTIDKDATQRLRQRIMDYYTGSSKVKYQFYKCVST